MNRTEIIEKIIERFKCEPYEVPPLSILKKILEEELPDFQRIDWERLRDCFEKASNGYVSSHLYVAVNQYNSTLSKAPAQPPALKPLPKEMPALWHDAFTDLLHNRMQPSEFYSLIRKTYGTAEPKPNLPSYHDLFKELYQISVKTQSTILVSTLTKHIIKKYSLHPREWWQDLKEGDKFMYAGQVYEYYGYEVNIRGEVTLWGKSTWKFRLSGCTPYTPPTAQDIIAKHNLSEEEIKIIKQS